MKLFLRKTAAFCIAHRAWLWRIPVNAVTSPVLLTCHHPLIFCVGLLSYAILIMDCVNLGVVIASSEI